MAILQQPPINQALVDPNTGKATQIFSGWLSRLWNRVGQDNGGLAPADAKYIVQTPNTELSNEQALSLLNSGFVKVTTGSGALTSTGNTKIQASDLEDTTITPATYTINGSTIFTVDQQGRLTFAASPTITAVPGGLAGGDLSSTYPNPSVIKIQSVAVTGTNATAVSNLTGVNSGDQTIILSGAVSGSGTGSITTSYAGILGATLGGTGLTSYSQGDIIYSSASNTLNTLSKDTNSTRYLSNQGTSNSPSWNQVNLSNGVTGTLSSTNGGTVAWQAWTPGFTGFSADPTYTTRYTTSGNICFISLHLTTFGTSNATTFTITGLPKTPANIGSGAMYMFGLGQDNSVLASRLASIATGSTTITCYATAALGAWTNSGNKGIWLDFSYEY